jgi:uncharacterized repeat protein (TIGR01451 family)
MLRHIELRAVIAIAVVLLPHSASAATPTDLLITKITSSTFTVGLNGTYTLTVNNVGAGATNDTITVVDELPTSLHFVSATGSGWACSVDGQTVTCITTGPLAPGTGSSIRLTVSVSSAAYPTVTNRASVSYAGDTNTANNTSRRPTTIRRGRLTAPARPTPTIPAPAGTATPTRTPTSTPLMAAAATDVLITKTIGKPLAVGATGSYVLTVANAGAATTNVPITVTDGLPPSLGFVSATGTGWTCSANGLEVSCHTGTSIAPGANSSSITLVVNVGSAAYPTVTNYATVYYAGDTNLANNTARRPTTVRGQARPPRPRRP